LFLFPHPSLFIFALAIASISSWKVASVSYIGIAGAAGIGELSHQVRTENQVILHFVSNYW